MNTSNPITSMATALMRALDRDLPPIRYERKGEKRERRPLQQEVSVCQFQQQWGSTALGFGGIGGAAMTIADTTVVLCQSSACVYFNGEHAYTIKRCNDLFDGDCLSQSMRKVADAKDYER